MDLQMPSVVWRMIRSVIPFGEDTPYVVDDVSVYLIVDAHLINWIYLPLISR